MRITKRRIITVANYANEFCVDYGEDCITKGIIPKHEKAMKDLQNKCWEFLMGCSSILNYSEQEISTFFATMNHTIGDNLNDMIDNIEFEVSTTKRRPYKH